MKTLPSRLLLAVVIAGGAAVSGHAVASTPASQPATVMGTPNETVVKTWTGSSAPGATGAGSTCPSAAAGDGHVIEFTIPAGLYDSNSVTADFKVEWADDLGSDMVLTVQRDGVEVDSSDTSGSSEVVSIVNPVAGTYTAIFCPFSATEATPYTGTLTLAVAGEAACTMPPTTAKPHAADASAPVNAGFDGGDLYRLPNFDRFLADTAGRRFAVPQRGFTGRQQPSQFDATLGLPTFLWAKNTATGTPVGALKLDLLLTARARAHLKNEAKALKLTPAMIDGAEVYDAGFNGNGPAVVRFRQKLNGLEVFHRSLNVLLDTAAEPVAVSGYFATDYVPAEAAQLRFTKSAAQAISAAWGTFGGALPVGQLLRVSNKAGYDLYSAPATTGNLRLERQPRVKPVYYPRAGRLEPAYYVELFSRGARMGQRFAYGFVVSGVDNGILRRDNLVANATPFTYRVFADPDGIHQPYDEPTGNAFIPFTGFSPATGPVPAPGPNSASSELVTLATGPISTGDPWLADDAEQTTGNHTDACIDSIDVMGVPIAVPAPVNSCLPDVEPRAVTTSPNKFDYPIAPFDDPATDNAKNAAVVGMFFTLNWLHDWWYDHGFDEMAGNAQTSNFDRGGAEGDPLLAQGQDASGRNNANMATPADGSSPVMQQYLFNGTINGIVEVKESLNLGSIPFNGVEYGPQTFDYTGDVAVVNDGFEPTNDACTGMTTPAGPAVPVVGSPVVPIPVPTPDAGLMGKIAVIVRGGGCPGSNKVRYAVQSGAEAVVLVHNADGPPPYLVNGDIPVEAPAQPTNMVYMIPIVTVSKADGQKIIDAIAAGQAVSMHLKREPTIDLDGTLDNLIIAHEYFHYVHNRLVDNGNNQSRSMGEGWGDIDGFMLSTRPDDRMVLGNDKFQGAYPGATWVTQDYFYGIRRAPYSTSFQSNPFTFKHIADGTATPDGGPGTTNSEVHASGEVWANMVWECYVGLLNDPRYGFDEAQSRMKDYIIGGLKMTPTDATFTEARDAILAVVKARDFGDYAACSSGFAKRGLGLNATSPARASTDHVGAAENYDEFVCKVDAPPASGGSSSSSGGSSSGAVSSSSSSGSSTSSGSTSSSGSSTSSSGGSTSSSSSSSSGSTSSGAAVPTDPRPIGGATAQDTSSTVTSGSTGSGRFGGGSLNLLLLLPLLGGVALRRRRLAV